MALGLTVKTGRILTAKLLLRQHVEGITYCAIGNGDATVFNEFESVKAPSNSELYAA